jgi:hypothetical protein
LLGRGKGGSRCDKGGEDGSGLHFGCTVRVCVCGKRIVRKRATR